MDIREASRFLGVSSGTLYVWVCQKRIPYVKIGRLTKFDPKDIKVPKPKRDPMSRYRYWTESDLKKLKKLTGRN